MKRSTLTTAIEYSIRDGMSIIPVGKDKKPLLPWTEFQTAPASHETIAEWWEKWPSANIGIVTGAISGITVVDVDTHSGGDPSPFPETYTVKTGNGGLQLYYKYDARVGTSANAHPQFPHVDIRNDGGFVVAPPSVITPTKAGADGRYVVTKDLPYSKFPIHLFPSQKNRNHKRRTLASLLALKEGDGRNNAMASFVGTMLRGIHPTKWDEHVWPALLVANQSHTPPMAEDELRTIYESITSREMARLEEEARKEIPSPVEITPEQKKFVTFRSLGLALTKDGDPINNMVNIARILRGDQKYAGNIRQNIFARDIEFRSSPTASFSELTEDRILDILIDIQHRFVPHAKKNDVADATVIVANENPHDEALEWMRSLTWDGTPRLTKWIERALGQSGAYYEAVGAQWFTAMVRRQVSPGCVWDNTLVLIGSQGVGKTSVFRIIGGKYYKAFSGSIEDKDVFIAMRKALIIDLDEGASLSRMDSVKWKGFMTRQQDVFRAPYDRKDRTWPRRFVFAMTTNDAENLRDTTGNRRFWPVVCKKTVDFDWLVANREQLFAEAYHVVANDTPLPYPTREDAEEHQGEHEQTDPWEDVIIEWVRNQYGYRAGDPDFSLTTRQLYEGMFEGEKVSRLNRFDSMRMGNILRRRLGFERARRRVGGNRIWVYAITEEKMLELQEEYKKHGFTPPQKTSEETFRTF